MHLTCLLHAPTNPNSQKLIASHLKSPNSKEAAKVSSIDSARIVRTYTFNSIQFNPCIQTVINYLQKLAIYYFFWYCGRQLGHDK